MDVRVPLTPHLTQSNLPFFTDNPFTGLKDASGFLYRGHAPNEAWRILGPVAFDGAGQQWGAGGDAWMAYIGTYGQEKLLSSIPGLDILPGALSICDALPALLLGQTLKIGEVPVTQWLESQNYWFDSGPTIIAPTSPLILAGYEGDAAEGSTLGMFWYAASRYVFVPVALPQLPQAFWFPMDVLPSGVTISRPGRTWLEIQYEGSEPGVKVDDTNRVVTVEQRSPGLIRLRMDLKDSVPTNGAFYNYPVEWEVYWGRNISTGGFNVGTLGDFHAPATKVTSMEVWQSGSVSRPPMRGKHTSRRGSMA